MGRNATVFKFHTGCAHWLKKNKKKRTKDLNCLCNSQLKGSVAAISHLWYIKHVEMAEDATRGAVSGDHMVITPKQSLHSGSDAEGSSGSLMGPLQKKWEWSDWKASWKAARQWTQHIAAPQPRCAAPARGRQAGKPPWLWLRVSNVKVGTTGERAGGGSGGIFTLRASRSRCLFTAAQLMVGFTYDRSPTDQTDKRYLLLSYHSVHFQCTLVH